MVSRFDCRWIVAHPWRWLRVMRVPWIVAAVVAAKAVVVTHPVYGMAAMSGVWPPILYGIAVLFAANAVVPLDRRVTATTSAVTLAVALLRILTFIEVAIRVDGPSRWLAAGFGLHWVIIAALTPFWPNLMETCGRKLTVEAGRGDRGHT